MTRYGRKQGAIQCGAALLFCLRMLGAQSVTTTPGFIQDLSGQFPLAEGFLFEPEIQLGTEGNSANGNPFAYGHAVQARPRVHYDGIPKATITGLVSYIEYFTAPGTSYVNIRNGASPL